MGRFLPGFLIATALCIGVVSQNAAAAPTCTYNSTQKTGSGCPENFKCSPRGVCEEAFTMAEIADAMKSPPAPYRAPPATEEECGKTVGWGIVEKSSLPPGQEEKSCLPTCQTYETLWRKTINPAQRPEMGYSGCTSYIMLKPENLCPKQDPARQFSQYPIAAFGTPKGFVCCVKVCAGDPTPYNYQSHILPPFGGNDQPESSGPKLGAPRYADGNPLPSAPAPRPFTGPAPKKRR